MLIYKVMSDGERGFVYEASPIIKHAAGTEIVYKSRTPRQTLKAVYARQVSRSSATAQEIVASLEEKGMFGAAGISSRLAAAKPKIRGGGGSDKLMGLARQEKPVTARLVAGKMQ